MIRINTSSADYREGFGTGLDRRMTAEGRTADYYAGLEAGSEARDRMDREPQDQPVPGWYITSQRDGFEYEQPAGFIPERIEGHDLSVIHIQGPGNRAIAISIELPDNGDEPIRVRVTEDGYGFHASAGTPSSPGIAWEPASDGGDAINLPVNRRDMER